MKFPLKRIVTVLVAAALLTYVLKGVSWNTIRQEFGRANYGWVIMVFISTIGSYIIRGKRSQQSLMALGYKPTTFRSTIALMSGNIASMIVPGAGEVTRCMTLNRTDSIPVSHAIGAVVGERILDLIMLVCVISLTFLLEFRRALSFFSSLSLASGRSQTFLIVGVLSFLIVSSIVLLNQLRRPQSTYPLLAKLRRGVLGLWQGIVAIKTLPNPVLFVVLAFLNQFLYWASTYWLLLALQTDYNLPGTAALMILTVSSIGGLAVPTQGGIGTYHFFVSRALVLYGLTLEEGVVAATFMHAVGFGINLILSGVSFLIVPFLVSQAQKKAEAISEP